MEPMNLDHPECATFGCWNLVESDGDQCSFCDDNEIDVYDD